MADDGEAVALSVRWFAVAVLLAIFEPRLAHWLDRPRGPGREQTPRRQG
jgi:hypothetical protein